MIPHESRSQIARSIVSARRCTMAVAGYLLMRPSPDLLICWDVTPYDRSHLGFANEIFARLSINPD